MCNSKYFGIANLLTFEKQYHIYEAEDGNAAIEIAPSDLKVNPHYDPRRYSHE
jgi:hypothetical protein